MFFDKQISIFFSRRGAGVSPLLIVLVAILLSADATADTFTSAKCGTSKCGQ